jgi:signal transduction histidine kinase
MMYNFLLNNREDLIARCKVKVAMRPLRSADSEKLCDGIPLFLSQLTQTLKAEESGQADEALDISGPAGGVAHTQSAMGVSAAAHGKELLKLGYSVDEVVHDYGDLCQSITDLAFERDAPFSVDEFRTLNRCLDNAIADAVTEFSFQRDAEIEEQRSAEANETLGLLVHELRNALSTASLAFKAIEVGGLPITGATGAVLKRSLAGLNSLVEQSMQEIRTKAATIERNRQFSLEAFITDVSSAATLEAGKKGCVLEVPPVDPMLAIKGNYQLLLAALTNLLNNAFKFTHEHSEVKLTAYAVGEHILIDVLDHCGGLPPGNAEKMFTPFFQRSADRSGVGLGLSIARRAIEGDGGKLSVRDMPGIGCVFTITLARHKLQ